MPALANQASICPVGAATEIEHRSDLGRGVARNGESANLGGRRLCRRGIEVVHHNTRSRGDKSGRQGLTDTAGSAGDDDPLITDAHPSSPPKVIPPSTIMV